MAATHSSEVIINMTIVAKLLGLAQERPPLLADCPAYRSKLCLQVRAVPTGQSWCPHGRAAPTGQSCAQRSQLCPQVTAVSTGPSCAYRSELCPQVRAVPTGQSCAYSS